ncbi:protein SSUH2 homolog [Larus michahellis]|uniref:protein SSUH2 homolog n=1 Tax=Larus michahellis TaxID=119627 RepID=UPI003D9BB23E
MPPPDTWDVEVGAPWLFQGQTRCCRVPRSALVRVSPPSLPASARAPAPDNGSSGSSPQQTVTDATAGPSAGCATGQPSSQLMLPDPAEMLNGVGETLPGEQRRLTPSSIDRRCVAMVRGKGELAVVKRGQALGMPYRKLRAVVRYAHFRAGASEWQRRLNPGVRAQLRIRPPLFSCSSAQTRRVRCKGSRRRPKRQERCQRCSGAGRRRCDTCSGWGSKTCATRQGEKKLQHFKQLVITWKNNIFEFVSEHHLDFPEKLLSKVSGENILKDEHVVVYTIIDFAHPEISLALQRAIAERSAVFATSSRILRQLFLPQLIPVTEVHHQHSGKSYLYYVRGLQSKVYVLDYPWRCCGCTLICAPLIKPGRELSCGPLCPSPLLHPQSPFSPFTGNKPVGRPKLLPASLRMLVHTQTETITFPGDGLPLPGRREAELRLPAQPDAARAESTESEALWGPAGRQQRHPRLDHEMLFGDST